MTTYTTRKEVPEQEKWNLTDIYSDLSKWEEDYLQIEKMSETLKSYDGNIHNGTSLYQYLKQKEELSFLFNKLYAFAMLKVDEDTRETKPQAYIRSCKATECKS